MLKGSLEKVLKVMKDSFKDIWTNELVLEATNATIAAQNIPEGQSIIPQGIATLGEFELLNIFSIKPISNVRTHISQIYEMLISFSSFRTTHKSTTCDSRHQLET